jgi:hypothetical protein
MTISPITSDLRRFLRYRLTAEQAAAAVTRRLRQRERSFLRLMQRTVYANPRSPYRALLQHAGVALADLTQSVARDGLEATLGRLHEAGVYVTAEEFKGRRPIRRPGLELAADPHDFDNPLAVGHFEARTGGSHGLPTPVPIDLRMVTHEATSVHAFLEGFGLRERPVATWRGVPPIVSGMRMILSYAKLGLPVERWFAQNKLPETPDTAASIRFTRDVIEAARNVGWPLPEPEYVHQDDAVTIARWLADWRAAGRPAQLDTNSSSGVRVCLAALDHGLDISGSFFRLGSEPYTEAKAAVIERAGCRAASHYATTELGRIGAACTAPGHVDEVHLLTDKFAFLQRAAPGDPAGYSGQVAALMITTLLPSISKIMLNVDSGDCGEIRRRDCGCPLGALGLDLHAWHLRSHEKLTSEGLNYLRGDLTALVEHVLPERFGGHASDYQLVEIEDEGMPFVEIVVSPRVGPVEAAAVSAAVYDWLRTRPGEELMADFWQDARTVRVVRRAPYATGAAKVLPLHRIAAGQPAGPPKRGTEQA